MSGSKEVIRLIRLHLRLRFNLSGLRAQWRGGGKGRGKMIGMGALMVYGFGCLAFMYGMMLTFVFSSVRTIEELRLMPVAGLMELIMGAIGAAAMTMCFIFGTISLIAMVFHAKDTELYAAMPLRQQSVFAAKLSMVYLTEIITSAALLVPAGIVYCVFQPLGVVGVIVFWLRLLAVLLVLPMIPLALAGFLGLGISRITMNMRKRDQMNMILQTVMIIGILALQLGIQTAAPSLFTDMGSLFMMDAAELMKNALGYFPPALWVGNALVGTGWTAVWQSAALLAASLAAFAVTLAVASRSYYKGALAQLEVAKSEKRKVAVKESRSGSAVSALALKEWRSVIRTPIYATNILLTAVIFPVVIAFMAFGPSSEGIAILLKTEGFTSTAVVAGAGAMAGFFVAATVGAASAFSREGRGLALLASFPLSAKDLLSAKLRLYQAVCVVTGLLSSAAFLLAGVSLGDVAAIALLSASCAFPAVEAQVLPDIAKPKLVWASEAEAIKQNTNSLLGMLTGILSLLPAVGAAVVVGLLGGGAWALAAVVAAVNLLVAWPLRLWGISLTKRLMAGIGG